MLAVLLPLVVALESRASLVESEPQHPFVGTNPTKTWLECQEDELLECQQCLQLNKEALDTLAAFTDPTEQAMSMCPMCTLENGGATFLDSFVKDIIDEISRGEVDDNDDDCPEPTTTTETTTTTTVSTSSTTTTTSTTTLEEEVIEEERTHCSLDIKICPGGIFVSRNIDKDCEWDDCPQHGKTDDDEQTPWWSGWSYQVGMEDDATDDDYNPLVTTTGAPASFASAKGAINCYCGMYSNKEMIAEELAKAPKFRQLERQMAGIINAMSVRVTDLRIVDHFDFEKYERNQHVADGPRRGARTSAQEPITITVAFTGSDFDYNIEQMIKKFKRLEGDALYRTIAGDALNTMKTEGHGAFLPTADLDCSVSFTGSMFYDTAPPTPPPTPAPTTLFKPSRPEEPGKAVAADDDCVYHIENELQYYCQYYVTMEYFSPEDDDFSWDTDALDEGGAYPRGTGKNGIMWFDDDWTRDDDDWGRMDHTFAFDAAGNDDAGLPLSSNARGYEEKPKDDDVQWRRSGRSSELDFCEIGDATCLDDPNMCAGQTDPATATGQCKMCLEYVDCMCNSPAGTDCTP